VIAAGALMAVGAGTGARAAPAFGESQVRSLAQALSRTPYRPPAPDLPPALAALSYDDYRGIRFSPDRALWKSDGLPFQLQLFHRGGLFRDRVDLFELAEGRVIPIAYSPDQFRFQAGAPAGLSPSLGFAGFRIHAPINTAAYYDEVAVFLGASYFRAVARDMLYGLSARGLAIGAGGVEEFPVFRTFWIERPAMGARSLTVLALLDGPSLAAAFRFVITPGETTTFDVTARMFPRRTIADLGVAPLTSMFLHGGEGGDRFDDFRPQVHDSDGLAIATGGGEHLWRALTNPASAVQVSAFADRDPHGFGLLQRERGFEAYEDLEARYEKRPSLWVEPKGHWGAGQVRLVELASRSEANDNVVAFWTPAAPLARGVPADFAYRLHWGRAEERSPGLVRQTRSGAGSAAGRRRFVVDFDRPDLGGVTAQVAASAGVVSDIVLHPNPERGARLSFELDPGQARAVELRAVLQRGDVPCSEVWLYRWIA